MDIAIPRSGGCASWVSCRGKAAEATLPPAAYLWPPLGTQVWFLFSRRVYTRKHCEHSLLTLRGGYLVMLFLPLFLRNNGIVADAVALHDCKDSPSSSSCRPSVSFRSLSIALSLFS